jgi:hypothetical protein
MRRLRLMRFPLKVWRGLFCVVMKRLEGKRDPHLFGVLSEEAAALECYWRHRISDEDGLRVLAEELRSMEQRELHRGKQKTRPPYSAAFVQGFVGFLEHELVTRERTAWPEYVRGIYDVVCLPNPHGVGAAQERGRVERSALVRKVKGARKVRRAAILIAAKLCGLTARSVDRLARTPERTSRQDPLDWLDRVDTLRMTLPEYRMFIRFQFARLRPQ